MMHSLHTGRAGELKPPETHGGAFVRWSKALEQFLIGSLSLVAVAFVVGLAWGALRAGILVAEHLLGGL